MRACLVKEPAFNGGIVNKRIADGVDCYWAAEPNKSQGLKQLANSRRKTFAFSVINLCEQAVSVTLTLKAGTLPFETMKCGDGTADAPILLNGIGPGRSDNVSCEAPPYGQLVGGSDRYRDFTIAPTAYGANASLVNPLAYDPRIVLEKTGEIEGMGKNKP